MIFKFSILAAMLAASEASLRFTSRHLSAQLIAGYEPRTQVTDHNAIDLDQDKIEELVAAKSDSKFGDATRVYREGSFSKSYAEVKVPGGLPFAVTKDTKITGTSIDGKAVSGEPLEAAGAGDTVLKIQYDTSDDQATYVNCQVGGNPDPNLDGCFVADGEIIINGTPVTYSYDPATENNNGRTIQGFATNDQRYRKNGESTGAYYTDFAKFVAYYGTPDYADKYITAALTGTNADFTNGDADFSKYGFDGRAQGAKKGTAFMSIAMYVLRELEDAIDDCEKKCSTEACNDDAVHALDEAVAFYTGTKEGTDGASDGVLMHALAEKRCQNFKTCGKDGNSANVENAKVNHDIFKEFNLMKRALEKQDCSAAVKNKERIAALIFVPLIQGTLRYAYLTEQATDFDEEAEAEGAVFAAAVLPVVHDCNPSDAATIYENMKIGQRNSATYKQVSEAFERNYECMKITCADVGGYYDNINQKYFEGTAPCGGVGKSKSEVNMGLAVGLPVGLIVAAVAAIFVFLKCCRKNDVEFKSSTAGTPAV